jgi:hypothetical protein
MGFSIFEAKITGATKMSTRRAASIHLNKFE